MTKDKLYLEYVMTMTMTMAENANGRKEAVMLLHKSDCIRTALDKVSKWFLILGMKN